MGSVQKTFCASSPIKHLIVALDIRLILRYVCLRKVIISRRLGLSKRVTITPNYKSMSDGDGCLLYRAAFGAPTLRVHYCAAQCVLRANDAPFDTAMRVRSMTTKCANNARQRCIYYVPFWAGHTSFVTVSDVSILILGP